MACNCGNNHITIRQQPILNRTTRCPRCQIVMQYKQMYISSTKRFIKLYECPKCRYKIESK